MCEWGLCLSKLHRPLRLLSGWRELLHRVRGCLRLPRGIPWSLQGQWRGHLRRLCL